MRRKLPPYVERNTVKGHVYLSFRRGGGQRIRLPDDPTSPEFEAAYADALAGNVAAKTRRGVHAKPGTLGALILSYQQSGDYRALRETTRRDYSTWLAVLTEKHAHRTLAGMTKEGINARILAPYSDRPGAVHALLRLLRVLIRHGNDVGMIRHNPTLGIRRPKLGRIRSWTDEEIAQFEARWPIGTRERLAFALMLYTGQRRSDVYKMTWAATTLASITVTQQKTGERLVIPLHSKLREILAETPREHVTILNTAFGQPFSVDGFSHFMRDAIAVAGLPLECQPHGLRKAAGRRLAEAGCTAKQIMAVLGHKSMSEAERYTVDANQAALAKAAIHRLETGQKRNKPPKPLSKSLVAKPKDERKSK